MNIYHIWFLKSNSTLPKLSAVMELAFYVLHISSPFAMVH